MAIDPPYRFDPYQNLVNVNWGNTYILITIEMTNTGPLQLEQIPASAPVQSMALADPAVATLIESGGDYDPETGFNRVWTYIYDAPPTTHPQIPLLDTIPEFSYFYDSVNWAHASNSPPYQLIADPPWQIWSSGWNARRKRYLLQSPVSPDPICTVSLSGLYPQGAGGQARLTVAVYDTAGESSLDEIVASFATPVASVSSAFLHDNWLPDGDYPVVFSKTEDGRRYVNIVGSPADWFVVEPPL